jgi:putative redox protein
VDNRSEFGGDDLGASPMELVDGSGGMQRYWYDFNSKEAATRVSSFKAEVEGERVQEKRSRLKIFMLFFI